MKNIYKLFLVVVFLMITVKVLDNQSNSSLNAISCARSNEKLQSMIHEYKQEIEFKNKQISTLKRIQLEPYDNGHIKNKKHYYLEKYPEILSCQNMNLKRWNPLKKNENIIINYSNPSNKLLQNTIITRGFLVKFAN